MPKPSKLRPYRPLIKAFLVVEKIIRQSPGHLTFSGRSDGIGAQIHAIFSLHAYAHLRNLTYYSAPLRDISHNDENTPDWDQKWNDFFNIPCHAAPIPPKLQAIDLRSKRVNWIQTHKCYNAARAHPVTDLFPSAYAAVMPSLRERYNEAPFHKKSAFPDSGLKIAVHIRRGDAVNHTSRSSDLTKIRQQIQQLKQTLNERKQSNSVIVFSQGTVDDFKALDDVDVDYYLNGDLFTTFHSLVTADVLITARSSLSYAAALLSEGLIIYEPFWHPPMNHWQTINTLSKTAMEHALCRS